MLSSLGAQVFHPDLKVLLIILPTSRGVLSEDGVNSVVQSLHSNDPDLIAIPRCAIWVKAPVATFELALLLKVMS